MTTKVAGLEGFFWWFGLVEDRNDPEKLGRVKVRVYNFHGDEVVSSKEDLPWASIIVPPTNSSLKQVGISPNGLQEGSTVFGFFADGMNGQIPVVLGSLHGIPSSDKDNHDVSLLAREVNNLKKEIIGPEPPSSFSSVYPFNKVFQSESGHVVELDDSPSKERIHLFHKIGTYFEINNQGRFVKKVVDDDIEVVVKNKTVFIKGNCNVEIIGNSSVLVNGNAELNVLGDYKINVSGNIIINGRTINLNNGTKGAARIDDSTDIKSGTHQHQIKSGSVTVFIGN